MSNRMQCPSCGAEFRKPENDGSSQAITCPVCKCACNSEALVNTKFCQDSGSENNHKKSAEEKFDKSEADFAAEFEPVNHASAEVVNP